MYVNKLSHPPAKLKREKRILLKLLMYVNKLNHPPTSIIIFEDKPIRLWMKNARTWIEIIWQNQTYPASSQNTSDTLIITNRMGHYCSMWFRVSITLRLPWNAPPRNIRETRLHSFRSTLRMPFLHSSPLFYFPSCPYSFFLSVCVCVCVCTHA